MHSLGINDYMNNMMKKAEEIEKDVIKVYSCSRANYGYKQDETTSLRTMPNTKELVQKL